MSVFKISNGINCHCWSPDRKRIAVCANDEKVLIYKNADAKEVSKWVLEHELTGHDLLVSAIDWSPVHNKIVTCSHDRNAFVWTFTGGKWCPSLSILRINRAALDVRWSPCGSKFAVASGSKVVPVCHYEQANDWWVSKIIKKHKSTVTSLSWHPNSQLLATASTDFRCRVFSAVIPNVDKDVNTFFGNSSKLPFGDSLAEFESSGGWIEGCAWSPDGSTLAFVSHDSAIGFVTFGHGDPVYQIVKTNFLPSQKILFISEDVVVTVGHSFKPDFFRYDGTKKKWIFVGSCDNSSSSGSASRQAKGSNFSTARTMWANKSETGMSENVVESSMETLHHSAITDIKPMTGTAKKVNSFSTSALDGRIIVWNEASLKAVPGI